MAHTDFELSSFMVVERGALRGVDPQEQPRKTYFATKNDAKTYADSRRGLFEHIDICRILTRINTTLTFVEVIEGDPL